MQLTERDKRLCLFLARVYYLYTSHVKYLGFPSYRYLVRRLNQQLVPAGYLKAHTLERNGENVYSLGPAGRNLVYDLTGIKPSYRGKTQLVQHFLDIADAILWFRRNGALTSFEIEKDFGILRSDAAGFWEGKGFLLEVERRENRIDMEGKIRALEAFYHSGGYKCMFERFPAVYVVTRRPDDAKRQVVEYSKLPISYYIGNRKYDWQKITGGGGRIE